jgi:hypothetical protein
MIRQLWSQGLIKNDPGHLGCIVRARDDVAASRWNIDWLLLLSPIYGVRVFGGGRAGLMKNYFVNFVVNCIATHYGL